MLLILACCVLVLYYWLVDPSLAKASRRFARRLPQSKHYPIGDLKDVLQLAVVGIAQLGLTVALLTSLDVPLRSMTLSKASPVVIVVDGVLLGIGQASAGWLLCYVAARMLMVLFPRDTPQAELAWVAVASGGWFRQFIRAFEILPVWGALTLALIYISGEEVIFRGILLTVGNRVGVLAAFFASVLCYLWTQLFPMSSRMGMVFPLVQSVVIGITNSALFEAVHDVRPLLVAHFVCFALALV